LNSAPFRQFPTHFLAPGIPPGLPPAGRDAFVATLSHADREFACSEAETPVLLRPRRTRRGLLSDKPAPEFPRRGRSYASRMICFRSNSR
jgi:hypothetical protein